MDRLGNMTFAMCQTSRHSCETDMWIILVGDDFPYPSA